MADSVLKQRISEILRAGAFSGPNDFVDVSDGESDFIHVIVLSRKFDGQSMEERSELFWEELERHLTTEEWGKVTLTVLESPEVLKAM